MECVPDLAFLQMAAATNSEMFNKMMWQTTAAGAAATGGGTMKQRKTNFTSREVESLLKAVADRKNTVLFGVAGGIGWARAWHEVAQAVSAVEGIHRSESDVRKKWTYLKWEAKNTSKPGRDPTSRAVLDILTSRDREAAQAAAAGNSLLEQLLVPGSSPGSPAAAPSKKGNSTGAGRVSPPGKEHHQQGTVSPQVTAHPQPSPTSSSAAPEVCLRWNSYHSNMQAVFPSLLNNEQFVDVTLACEGRSIKCHKVMLSACSSYLEELLSQNPCQHPIVFMRDLKFWELQALVEFMYSGEVNVTQDKLPSLLAAADALQIKGLAGPFSGTTSSSHGEEEQQFGENEETTAQFVMNKRSRKRKSANPLPYIHQAHTPIGVKQFASSAPSKWQSHSSPPHLAQLPPRHHSPAPAVSQSAATPSSVRMSPPPSTHAARSTPTPPVSAHSLKFHGSPRRPQSPQVVVAPSVHGGSRTDSCSPGLSTGLPGPPHPYRPPADDDDEKPLALCTNNEPLNLGMDSKEHGSGKSNELSVSTIGTKEENGIRPVKEEMVEEDEDDDDEDDGEDRPNAYE